jgi:hypothetical protein
MNVILSILQLLLEVFRELYQKQRQDKAQSDSDAIDRDPADAFLSRFKRGDKDSSSISNATKHDDK